MIKERLKRIEERKQTIGTQHRRKLNRYSDNFNNMFNFLLRSYRSGILTFSGSTFKVTQDLKSDECKMCFRRYDNGDYRNIDVIYTRHPNVLKAIINAKKSLGLWIDQWSDGIVECNFTLDDILSEFGDKNIEIPLSILNDFKNRIDKKKRLKYGKELNKYK